MLLTYILRSASFGILLGITIVLMSWKGIENITKLEIMHSLSKFTIQCVHSIHLNFYQQLVVPYTIKILYVMYDLLSFVYTIIKRLYQCIIYPLYQLIYKILLRVGHISKLVFTKIFTNTVELIRYTADLLPVAHLCGIISFLFDSLRLCFSFFRILLPRTIVFFQNCLLPMCRIVILVGDRLIVLSYDIYCAIVRPWAIDIGSTVADVIQSVSYTFAPLIQRIKEKWCMILRYLYAKYGDCNLY